MNSRQKAREAVRLVDGKRKDPFGDFRANAAFDSMLEDLDSDEMREVVAHTMCRAIFGHDAQFVFQFNQASQVLIAIRAKLTEET